jgi:predicted nucleic acid-binding protein
VILVDAGPLVALVNRGDDAHGRCKAALAMLPVPLLTTWAAFTEAMYLVGAVAGWHGQNALWALYHHGALQVAEPTVHMLVRVSALMEKYQDMPMDLADASLVALAETHGYTRIFTLDSDFATYRIGGKRKFILIP